LIIDSLKIDYDFWSTYVKNRKKSDKDVKFSKCYDKFECSEYIASVRNISYNHQSPVNVYHVSSFYYRTSQKLQASTRIILRPLLFFSIKLFYTIGSD